MTIQDTDPGSKSAVEVEREVRQSRAKVERTLDQIQDRLSPGQMVDQAMSYLRDSGGSEFAHNLGESVKQNPMPLALVAVGVAWMVMSGRRPANDGPSWDRDRWAGDRHDGGRAGWEASLVYPSGRPMQRTGMSTGGGTDREHGGQDGGNAIERAREVAQAAKDKAGDLVGRAREAVGDAAGAVSDTSDEVGRKASESVDSARAAARRAQFEAERYGRRAKRSILESFQEQPLVLGAIGVAVGAAIGAALPPTETEDELIGETGDRIKREADRTGREHLATAQSAAGAAASAALAETERQGLKTDSVKAAANSVRSKVERVADAAKEAAKERAEKEHLGGKRGVT